MNYAALLLLHLLAVAAFISGLFLLALSLPGLNRALPLDDARQAELRRLRRWTLFVTSPALLLVWAAGLGMALEAGWFVMLWLKLKVALVVGLSALHGLLLGAARRIAAGRPARPGLLRAAPWLIAAASLIILVLVTAKP
ncbi:CopD family protein [Sphingomonas morindae]|uniref:Protoporphyrinogen IX oxidase n=1 Tax=Sphingomonas morindae TaxID=1541170 RepID=A0ABY4X3I5_9SPHN|nr:CopD family protein [Sphingomonas morindae]USI71415.1 CopD family protein [Sphingomonas morindae]